MCVTILLLLLCGCSIKQKNIEISNAAPINLAKHSPIQIVKEPESLEKLSPIKPAMQNLKPRTNTAIESYFNDQKQDLIHNHAFSKRNIEISKMEEEKLGNQKLKALNAYDVSRKEQLKKDALMGKQYQQAKRFSPEITLPIIKSSQ